MARASRFLESRVDAWRGMVSGEGMALKGRGGTMMALELTGASDIQEVSCRASLRMREGSKRDVRSIECLLHTYRKLAKKHTLALFMRPELKPRLRNRVWKQYGTVFIWIFRKCVENGRRCLQKPTTCSQFIGMRL